MNATFTTPTTGTIASPPRHEPFLPIHKGLRRALFETSVQLARTDFAAPGETADAERAVETCFHFLREHAEHEDRHVVPIVAGLNPSVGEALIAAHPRLERAAIAVDSLWPRLVAADPTARAALGRELVRRFQIFVAQQLEHMDYEERDVTQLLWARLSDPEIIAIGGRIVASIEPVRMGEWMALVLPSLNQPEREAMSRR